jgi:DNA-directed RNA polymerase III subunit RPC8
VRSTLRREGLQISLGFFQDITVPEYCLQEPSHFDSNEALWYWKFDGNEMWMDLEERVQFRVQSVKFQSVPKPGHLQARTAGIHQRTSGSYKYCTLILCRWLQESGNEGPFVGSAELPFSPMEVIGDINGDGLGLTSWWSGGDDMEP